MVIASIILDWIMRLFVVAVVFTAWHGYGMKEGK